MQVPGGQLGPGAQQSTFSKRTAGSWAVLGPSARGPTVPFFKASSWAPDSRALEPNCPVPKMPKTEFANPGEDSFVRLSEFQNHERYIEKKTY